MAASLSGVFNVQQFTDAGLPAAGYRLYTYAYGTTTNRTAYTDAAGTVAHTYTSDGAGGSYIALNARGELPAPLYLSGGSYDLALKTPAGATVWTRRADPTVNGADLASSTDATKGAALMGFNPALTYPTGTIGAALNADPIVANESSFPGITSGVAAVATPAFQSFVTACRGKRGYIPPGDYWLNAAITYDPQYPTEIFGAGYNSDAAAYGTRLNWSSNTNGFEVIYAYAQWPVGGGGDKHTSQGGTLGNSDNRVVFRGLQLYGPGITTLPGSKSLQLYDPGSVTWPTGTAFFCYWANDLTLEDCWASGWPVGGLYMNNCFSSNIKRFYAVANRSYGIVLDGQCNAFSMSGVRCIANGAVSGAFKSYNCFIGNANAAPLNNLGVVIDQQCDFEGAGSSALPGYIFSGDAATHTITSINVTSNVATVVLVGTVNFAVGHYIGIRGGTTANGNAVFNSVTPFILSSKVGSTITFQITAANGSYTVTDLVIGPYAIGLGIGSTFGATVNMYSEGCFGPGLEILPTTKGITVTGSTVNDNKIYVDGYYQLDFPTIVSGGTGYTVNDTLTIVGGTLWLPTGAAAKLTVSAVSGGVITAVTVFSNGGYSVFPTGTVSVTGGTGSGATFTLVSGNVSATGVALIGNQMYGVGAGITSVIPDNVVAYNNQYLVTAAGQPTLSIGGTVLAEAGNLVVQGGILGTGRNVYKSTIAAGDITNWGSGPNVLQAVQQDGLGLGHGQKLVVFGPNAGASMTVGFANTLMGWNAGTALTTGSNCVGIGTRAIESGVNLSQHVAVGFRAGFGITSGGDEVNIGAAAGVRDTASATNGNNVHVGSTAGRITNGASTGNTTIIGAQSAGFAPTSGMSNYMGLGYNTQADATYVPQSNRTVIGNSSTIDTVLYGVAVLVPKTVATLPAASTLLKGAKSFVTDASATMTAGIGAVVASGGANNVPVYCDGTNWRIG